MVWIFFLGAVVDDYPSVRDGSVFGNIWDVGGGHDKHSVGTLLSRLVVALTHATNFFAKSCHPGLRGCRVFHKTSVAADGFASGGVEHGHCKVFIVDMACGLGSQFLGMKCPAGRRSLIRSWLIASWLIRRLLWMATLLDCLGVTMEDTMGVLASRVMVGRAPEVLALVVC